MTYDVLIIGSGLAGMSAAIRLATSKKVALVTKLELLVGASSWAQGGIAAVLDSGDTLEDHIRDTHVAGAGLCHDDAVRFVVERGRQSVEWLVAQGVPFTRDDDKHAELHLTREGGHSHRRIAHARTPPGARSRPRWSSA
jgi:L-aspartate oxidase